MDIVTEETKRTLIPLAKISIISLNIISILGDKITIGIVVIRIIDPNLNVKRDLNINLNSTSDNHKLIDLNILIRGSEAEK